MLLQFPVPKQPQASGGFDFGVTPRSRRYGRKIIKDLCPTILDGQREDPDTFYLLYQRALNQSAPRSITGLPIVGQCPGIPFRAETSNFACKLVIIFKFITLSLLFSH